MKLELGKNVKKSLTDLNSKSWIAIRGKFSYKTLDPVLRGTQILGLTDIRKVLTLEDQS